MIPFGALPAVLEIEGIIEGKVWASSLSFYIACSNTSACRSARRHSTRQELHLPLRLPTHADPRQRSASPFDPLDHLAAETEASARRVARARAPSLAGLESRPAWPVVEGKG